MQRALVLTAVIALSIAAALTTSASARQTRQDPDTLTALLVEVRGLRAAIEQMSSAGARVQLAMGRLQLNEQRIATYVRRLDEVRDRRVAADLELSKRQKQLASLMDDARTSPQPLPPWFQDELTKARAGLDETSATVQRFKNEEAVLTREIANEQDRWTEINRTLDDLDRALTRVK